MVIQKFFKSLVDFIFPPQCYVCKKILKDEDGLCFECLSKINFISKPMCECCGYPFEFKISSSKYDLLCPRCLMHTHKFDKCVSVVRYDETSKKIILPFKHGDKTQLAKFMAKLMCVSGKKLIADSDVIIPVPIHFTRMLKRKYNQASLLCNFIARQYNKKVLYSTLLRNVATKSQGHMSLFQRKHNVSGAFIVRHPEQIKGKSVLLIDDVFTTGSTVDECAKVLRKNGAKKIFVLTFARVVK